MHQLVNFLAWGVEWRGAAATALVTRREATVLAFLAFLAQTLRADRADAGIIKKIEEITQIQSGRGSATAAGYKPASVRAALAVLVESGIVQRVPRHELNGKRNLISATVFNPSLISQAKKWDIEYKRIRKEKLPGAPDRVIIETPMAW